jgi:hypothetical protein
MQADSLPCQFNNARSERSLRQAIPIAAATIDLFSLYKEQPLRIRYFPGIVYRQRWGLEVISVPRQSGILLMCHSV